jgi:hypothetical protein
MTATERANQILPVVRAAGENQPETPGVLIFGGAWFTSEK